MEEVFFRTGSFLWRGNVADEEAEELPMLDLQTEHVPDGCWQLGVLDVTPTAVTDQPGAVARHVRPATLLEVRDQLLSREIGHLLDLLIEGPACLVEGTGDGPGLHDSPRRTRSRRSS